MNSQGKHTIVDHIRVPYNEKIKDLLLVERQSANYDIFLNNKKVATQNVSSRFMKFATAKGFVFRRSQKITLEGVEHIDGIKVSIQKNYDKQKILRELIISVPAASPENMVENRKKIQYWIEKFSPDTKIENSISDKYVRC